MVHVQAGLQLYRKALIERLIYLCTRPSLVNKAILQPHSEIVHEAPKFFYAQQRN